MIWVHTRELLQLPSVSRSCPRDTSGVFQVLVSDLAIEVIP
jgi:hypothetical protein